MADKLVYIPRELNLMQAPQKKRVCRQAYDLLQKYSIVKIEK